MSARPFAVAALLIALAGPAVAQPPENRPRRAEVTSARLLAPFQPVVVKVNESTVRVMSDGKEAALGTVVFADGYILTKASELKGEVSVQFADGGQVAAKVVGQHKATDLALLKVGKTGLVPLTFADSKVAALGNWLAAAGVGSDPTAVGIVSVVTRTLSKMEQGDHLNTKRGYLGVTMSQKDVTDGGAEIEMVSKGGAAEKAGIRRGDVIYEVNGKEIRNSDALREMLGDFLPGQKVDLGIRRKGEDIQMKVTLAGPPAGFQNRSDIQNTMGGALSGRRGGFETVLQTDMVVDPKNCGGAVVDLDGRVIGVCIARAGRVETYVLPGEIVRPLLADLRAGKFPPPTRPAATVPADEGKTAPAPRRPAGGGDPSQGNPR
ncbi:MAG TPA: trypsin-like peptidase domain-containing protein [Urbifossiella sp.]|jgi:serine protease Do|nr:trypsin-like peptidase domain-containing protein [Urbifossiella sp.]